MRRPGQRAFSHPLEINMARSPENAQAKDAALKEQVTPTKQEVAGRLLKSPDGFVYVWTESLSKQDGFVAYTGKVNAAGFAEE
jgi:hypothetical protein